jgi:hypothetical protein
MSSDWKKKNGAEIKEVTADIERSSDIKKRAWQYTAELPN